jgi:hypothetical protein
LVDAVGAEERAGAAEEPHGGGSLLVGRCSV